MDVSWRCSCVSRTIEASWLNRNKVKPDPPQARLIPAGTRREYYSNIKLEADRTAQEEEEYEFEATEIPTAEDLKPKAKAEEVGD